MFAHGVGRFGNWWNQELFGKPTDRPWGLEIDPENRPFEYATAETFHPTFLYEFLYVTAAGVLLLVLDRFIRFRPPALFALYVMLYTFGRFFEELLRIDPSHELGPLRLNAWVSIVVFVLATAFFVYWQLLQGGRAGRAAAARAGREAPKDAPAMAIPKGRVRPPRASAADGDAGSRARARPRGVRGPFDLLLALVLRDELDLGEVDVAGIVLAFLERLAEREELDLDACGEFLVLVAALLELKARALLTGEETDLEDLDPAEAAAELARRLAEYRRIKEAAAWLVDRLDEESDRYFRLGPARLRRRSSAAWLLRTRPSWPRFSRR